MLMKSAARWTTLFTVFLLVSQASACGSGENVENLQAAGESGVRPAVVKSQTAAIPDPGSSELTQGIFVWAAAMCAIQVEFEEQFTEIDDNIDPTTLDLKSRKTRYQHIGPVQSRIYTDVAIALAQMQPPNATRAYHEAELLRVQMISEGLQRQSKIVNAATTTDEINSTNEELNKLRLRTRAAVNFAKQSMPGPARTALAACGLGSP